jgi:hypothetical protein
MIPQGSADVLVVSHSVSVKVVAETSLVLYKAKHNYGTVFFQSSYTLKCTMRQNRETAGNQFILLIIPSFQNTNMLTALEADMPLNPITHLPAYI